jgi:hypothetical protein
MGRTRDLLSITLVGAFCITTLIARDRNVSPAPLNQSDNDLFSAEPENHKANWYSKTLDLSMHIWSDLDMLSRALSTFLPDQVELIFNASLGKMVHLNWCLAQLFKSEGSQADDFEHLSRIIQSVEKLCLKIVHEPVLASRVESTQEILRGITKTLNAA